MDGNRHKATAQLMPSGRKQDWGGQPLFDQSDLYVIPEALIYEKKEIDLRNSWWNSFFHAQLL